MGRTAAPRWEQPAQRARGRARRCRVSASLLNPLNLDVGDPVTTAVSLGVATAGGFGFQAMGVPLPWILGSMFACTAASLAGTFLPLATLSLGSLRRLRRLLTHPRC